METPDFTLDGLVSDGDYDYNYTFDINSPTEDVTPHKSHTFPTFFEEPLSVFLFVVNVIIFLLGICGNGVVIWIAGFKMKKTVNTTWYLSLAISDFIFCAFLPFNIAYMATSEWKFGLFMCKFTSFVMFLNMFSSIFLLVIISVDRCVSVMFPVWAQNHRTVKLASGLVVLAWILSGALSVPSIVYRDITTHRQTLCVTNFTSNYIHASIATNRFIFSFMLPLFIIIICYSIIIIRLRANRMARSTKPFRVMTALIVTFFLCWLPYHTFVLMEISRSFRPWLIIQGLRVGTTVATANSFLNPLLYVFMGNDFRRKFKNSLLSKIENAIGDEVRTSSRYLSRSSSVDARTSTHI